MSEHWAPVTTATPGREAHVEVDSPCAPARVRLHRDALARLVAGRPVPATLTEALHIRGLRRDDVGADSRDPVEAGDLAQWQDKGWGLSLSYYLWSRRTAFFDDGHDSEPKRAEALQRMLDRADVPTPDLPRRQPALSLSDAGPVGELDVGNALRKRKSVLKPRGEDLARSDLARLLRDGTRRFVGSRRLAENPTALTDLLVSYGSAIDIYVLVYRSPDLKSGVYVLDPQQRALTPMELGDVAEGGREALLAHPDPIDAAATIALVADFGRYQWRYRHERAMRNLWIEAGRILQELLISAASLGMQTGITPAVSDSAFLRLLALEATDSQVLHTMTISGRPAPGSIPDRPAQAQPERPAQG
ncbi:MAG: hypothetical protein GEU83_16960 [Pseudonocardiaceae bacterium]|nr:hypothetical protein [Pseudonocardiaceae bacterium]